MFTKSLEALIGQVYSDARKRRLKLMGVEHLLVGLLRAESMAELWGALKVDVPALDKALSRFIKAEYERYPPGDMGDCRPTLGFQRVLQRSVYRVQSAGGSEVRERDVLLAIFGEKDSKAVDLLHAQDVTRLDVANFIYHGHERTEKSDAEQVTDKVSELLPPDAESAEANAPKRIFISYAHADEPCLQRLIVHLGPLVRQNVIDQWSDKRIRPGDQWRREIRRNLDEAQIAILLVSADFLASDFIMQDELPPLLVSAEQRGVTIIPVILKPCGYLRDPALATFQSVNDPREPLLGLSHVQQEAIYDQIANEVHARVTGKA